MVTRMTLGHYFEAWQRNHMQSDEELAAYLSITVDRLAALAAEPVETEGEADPTRPMPAPPLSTDLDSIAERHGVNDQRLRNVIYGRY
jgi:hypothetical protein